MRKNAYIFKDILMRYGNESSRVISNRQKSVAKHTHTFFHAANIKRRGRKAQHGRRSIESNNNKNEYERCLEWVDSHYNKSSNMNVRLLAIEILILK